MNIRRKIIAVFLAMILLIVGINTYYLSATNIKGSDAFSEGRFVNMAAEQVSSAEQYFSLMDLAVEELISDTEFLNAFSSISEKGDSDPIQSRVWQNKLSDTLYHSAVAANFYRVSVFCRNGYYLSNHIDRNDSLQPLSEETQEVIAGLAYLAEVDETPYRRHVIPTHNDPFTLGKQVKVFSIVRGILYHGTPIGYIEVSSDAAELERIFRTDNPAVKVHAVFTDGTVLYDTGRSENDYRDIPLNTYLDQTPGNGRDLIAYHTQSRWLGMDLYLTQETAVRNMQIRFLISQYVRFSAVIGVIASVLVILISWKLTRSIRQLAEKMQSIPAEQMVKSEEPPGIDDFVTSAADAEIHDLEKQFNHLVSNLHAAARNEIALRDKTTNARLNALQAQINPHFVYNTLNIIAAKGLESGNEEVTDLCFQFAQMLRYSTDTRSKSVLLREDVEHVTNYLMLLKARYEDGLEYAIEIPEQMQNVRIPRLTLQPLVENSIIHGFDDGVTVRNISIRGEIRDGRMLLEVRDNGRGFSPETLIQLRDSIEAIIGQPATEPESSGHIGILNTCWRLRHYSKDALIVMQVDNDCGAVVRLWFDMDN